MTEPQTNELILTSDLVISTRITALDRAIEGYKLADTPINDSNIKEILSLAQKIEAFLLTGEVAID